MTDKEAIKNLKAMPKVLKAFAKMFGGTTDPKVKATIEYAIQAIRDREMLLQDRSDP